MMATYFHGGAEMQAAAAATGDNNLQTLYLMNPNFITSAGGAAAYSEAHHSQSPPNMLLLNPTATPNTLTQGNISPHQQLVGIPLSRPHSNDPSRPSDHHHHHHMSPAMHGLGASRVHYNLWSPTNEASPSQPGSINELGHMGFRRPVSAAQQGGLSLSLSPGQQNHHQQHHHQQEDLRMAVTIAGGTPMTSNGVIKGSKYLKAAQELLEEVANVSSVDHGGESSGVHKDKHPIKEEDAVADGDGGESSKKAAELTTAQRQELQMKKDKLLNVLEEVEQRYRQYHTQMQVVVASFEQAAGHGSAKLYTSLALKTISKQFRCLKDAIASQIKATSKSLGEEDSGGGGGGGKFEGGSRLRFVDHQLRQQRALQQLGMMHQNAWRPQRGLPERAVSVLRAWLFEHFLHPYPKDSDKHLLAKQTGLTRSQVSNWFINARVRLWKPMVEEMYVEEMKTQEQNGGNSDEKTNNNGGGICNSSSRNERNHENSKDKSSFARQLDQQQDGVGNNNNNNLIQTHQHDDDDDGNNNNNHQTTNDMISSLSAMSTTSSQGFTLIGSTSDMESLMARSPKKQRSNSDMNSPSSILSMDMEMKPLDQTTHPQINRQHLQRHHSSLMSRHGDQADHQAGFNPYIVNEMGRFNPDPLSQHQYHGNNGVSLTLGLPHCENLSTLSGNHQQNFMANQGMQLGRRLDIGPNEGEFCGISMGQPSHPSNGYESIDIQSRKRFATHQILHDFVA